MIFKRKPRVVTSHLPFTPDPEQAAALERRLADLSYRPKYGFLRDHQQERHTPATNLTLARFAACEPGDR